MTYPRFSPARRISRLRPAVSVLFAGLLVLALLLAQIQPAAAHNPPPPGPGPLDKITKTASKGFVTPGETFTYTIHLENSASTPVTAGVRDPLPAGLDYVDGSADHGGVYHADTRTLTWSGLAVVSGSPLDLTFQMTYAAAVLFPTPTPNTAGILWNGMPLMRTAWVTRMPSGGGGSSLGASFKSASPRMLAPSEKVTYTIHLLNTGASAVTAGVEDPLPAQLTYVDGSASAGGTYDSATRTVSWSDVSVPAGANGTPGEPVLLTFEAQAPAVLPASILPPAVVNTAKITSGGVTIRRSVPVMLVQPISPLQGSYKTASERAVAAGAAFTYTIHLHNSSAAAVTAAVSDPLPEDVTYVEGSASAGGTYDPATRTLAWADLSVDAGETLDLTFDVTAPAAVAAPRAVTNTAAITSGGVTLRRAAVVWLLPAPCTGDCEAPRVQSVTIENQDVLDAREVTLHTAATDNVAVTKMAIKEWVINPSPRPHWEEVASSGWIPFAADAPWTLSDRDGSHFIGVWVADAAANHSRMSRAALDFASLARPGAALDQGEMLSYLVYYPAGVDVTAAIDVTAGAAQLFVWDPGNLFDPNHGGPGPIVGAQSVSFTTRVAGMYMFLVRAAQDGTTYDLSIAPAGGPRVPVDVCPWPHDASSASLTGAADALADALTVNPILSQSGLDPLSIAIEPGGSFGFYLPAVKK